MLSIIVAVAKNGVIGANNQLLWHISDDLKRFKQITSGCPIIMGRKTFESLGRPLPNRHNIVITRNDQFVVPQGVTKVSSLTEAVAAAKSAMTKEANGLDQEIFIIGGGEIYRQAIDMVDKMYVTEVDQTPEGDTFFPEIDKTKWRELTRQQNDGFAYVDYVLQA